MAISPQRFTIYLYSAHRAVSHLCDSTAFSLVFVADESRRRVGSGHGDRGLGMRMENFDFLCRNNAVGAR